MAKKTHIKVRLVPETKPDSPFFYYVKKPAGGEKAKVKLKLKKYNYTIKQEKISEKSIQIRNVLHKYNSIIIKLFWCQEFMTRLVH